MPNRYISDIPSGAAYNKQKLCNTNENRKKYQKAEMKCTAYVLSKNDKKDAENQTCGYNQI